MAPRARRWRGALGLGASGALAVLLLLWPLKPAGAMGAGGWRTISLVGAPAPASGSTAVWTDRQMLVFGGFGCGRECGTGGVYDPSSDTWQPMTPTRPREGHTAVWTGTVLLVFGAGGTCCGGSVSGMIRRS